jgi:hypothetical protein
MAVVRPMAPNLDGEMVIEPVVPAGTRISISFPAPEGTYTGRRRCRPAPRRALLTGFEDRIPFISNEFIFSFSAKDNALPR